MLFVFTVKFSQAYCLPVDIYNIEGRGRHNGHFTGCCQTLFTGSMHRMRKRKDTKAHTWLCVFWCSPLMFEEVQSGNMEEER